MRGNAFPSVTRKRIEWINLDHARKRDLEKIAALFGLSASHRQALYTRDHRSHVHEGIGYTLVVLVHPVFDQTSGDIQAREMDVLLTPTRIVTVHHGHLLPVSQLFHEVEVSPKRLTHPAHLFGEVLHELLVDASHTLDHLATQIDAFEQSLTKRQGRGGIQSILQIQTNIIDTKKLLENQRYIVDRLLLGQPARVRARIQNQYDEIRGHQEELTHVIETELQAAQTLHRVLDASINERTNALIRALTVLSLIMLPATLIAGIFGMNTSHPWVLGLPHDFSIIMGVMLVTGVLILALIRSKRL